MVLKTGHLGEVHYSNEDIIKFSDGIPGFPEYVQYIFIPSGDEALPFHYLQCIEDSELAFVVTDPFVFAPNYDFDLSDTEAEKLGIESLDDLNEVMILAVVNIPSRVEDATMNIMAPIIISQKTKKGKQIVLSEYDDTRYPLFKKSEEVE